MYDSPLASRTDSDGPCRPADHDTRRPRRPKEGPDLETPTQKPLPRLLRREKRNGIYVSR